MFRRAQLYSCFILLFSSGCAFERGAPFGVLADVQVRAELAALLDRSLPDGWSRLNTDYQVRFERAELELSELELREPASSSGGERFDPSRPPPGYSLCHGGHCHRDDGALVPYEEVAAEAGVSGTGGSTVASFVIGKMTLLPGSERTLTTGGAVDLPRVQIRQARALLAGFHFAGRVRDARVPPRFAGEIEWRITAGGQEPATALRGELDLPVDREHPPAIRLRFVFSPSAAVFDDIDWGAQQLSQGVVDFGAAGNEAAHDVAVEHLLNVPLSAQPSRSTN